MDWRSYWHHGAAALAALPMLWIAFVEGNRIPLLGWFDLGIHELGHMITTPFGTTISFVMGSGLQALVPLGLAAYFWFWQRHHAAAGIILVWAATSLQDVSVYIADAPFRALQLIGGTHDWWFLLSGWGKLEWADEIAQSVWVLGLLIGLAGVGLVLWPAVGAAWVWLGDVPGHSTPASATARVRQPRDRPS